MPYLWKKKRVQYY